MCAPLQACKEEARHANEEMEKREKEGDEEHNALGDRRATLRH